MLFNCFNLWMLKVTKIAKLKSVKAGISQTQSPPSSIIEKLYNPCKKTAIIRPKRKIFPLCFVSQKERARKYPSVPEDKAWRKVAPKNRNKLIEKVLPNTKAGPRENKIKMFSEAAKPKAAIII